MPNYLHIFLLYTAAALTTATTLHHSSSLNSSSPAPSPSTATNQPPPLISPSSPSSPPQSSPEYMQQQQIKNILDALIGAGDFAAWANILFNPITSNSSIPTALPTTATFFVPGNEALSRLSGTATGAFSFDPFIIPYHVLPQRLSFSDLQLFKPRTRLPTLLPSKTLLITDNDPTHFTVDDALITHPDLYSNGVVCMHGIETVLDYKVYGEPDRNVDQESFVSPPPLPTVDETVLAPPVTEVVGSGGVVLLVGFLIRVVGVGLGLYAVS